MTEKDVDHSNQRVPDLIEFKTDAMEFTRKLMADFQSLMPDNFDDFIDLSKKYEELFGVQPGFSHSIVTKNFRSFDELYALTPVERLFGEKRKGPEILYSDSQGSFFLKSGLKIELGDRIIVEDYNLWPNTELFIPEQRILLNTQTNRIEQIIERIYGDNNQLSHIHHTEFEEMMAEILRSRDFDVELTKRTRDGGKDIIAFKNFNGVDLKFLIECKHNRIDRKVGVQTIRSFSHVVNKDKANKGMIFTTSYFTEDACKEQREYMGWLLDLNDRDEVLKWVNNYVC